MVAGAAAAPALLRFRHPPAPMVAGATDLRNRHEIAARLAVDGKPCASVSAILPPSGATHHQGWYLAGIGVRPIGSRCLAPTGGRRPTGSGERPTGGVRPARTAARPVRSVDPAADGADV